MNYRIQASARIQGKISLGKGAIISYGTIIESEDHNVQISNNSFILENSYVKGTKDFPVHIGQKTVFGHRCKVLGATIGNCCEIGNGTVMEEGVIMGDFCVTGEGTYIPKGSVIPEESVLLGNPYRIIRKLSEDDKKMIARMRGNDLSLTEEMLFDVEDIWNKEKIQTLVTFRGISPKVGQSKLEDEVELIGDVHLGDGCVLKKGVKIIGDSHGKVRIGHNVEIGEDTVIHLLPDNHVRIEDGVVIGKNCIIHGCVLEEDVVIEDECNICDNSHVGKKTRVKEGSLLPQRRTLGEGLVVSGNPVKL